MREPLDFDISISADKKRRRTGRRGMTGAVETSTRKCEYNGCNAVGNYRAPQSPDRPGEFHWFCRKHVREYNQNWDFFKAQANCKDLAEKSESRVETKSVEERRTEREKLAWSRLGVNDPTEILGTYGTRKNENRKSSKKRVTPSERRALAILEADESWSKNEIRRQYRVLVKHLHPDMNGGDRTDESRLKEVVWAWDQINSSKNFQQ